MTRTNNSDASMVRLNGSGRRHGGQAAGAGQLSQEWVLMGKGHRPCAFTAAVGSSYAAPVGPDPGRRELAGGAGGAPASDGWVQMGASALPGLLQPAPVRRARVDPPLSLPPADIPPPEHPAARSPPAVLTGAAAAAGPGPPGAAGAVPAAGGDVAPGRQGVHQGRGGIQRA